MAFKKGGKPGPGRPKGSGRNQIAKDWAEKYGLRFLMRVAEGKEKETIAVKNGKAVKVPADLKTRVDAARYVCDQGLGRAPQAITHKGDEDMPVVFTLKTDDDAEPDAK